jgi:DNA-binding transcriptional MerR regulator
MFKALPIMIPDVVLDWSGTAGELADKCNELMPEVGLKEEEGAANERLIRHYVQLGVLSPPVRQGREALYGARQVLEFVIARYLLRDGWPLAKIAELVKTYDLPDSRLPSGEGEAPTAAERALARIRESESVPRRPAASEPSEPGIASASLGRAAEISTRRIDLGDKLRALGNPAGTPTRSELVRLQLTPWCTVDIDLARLRRLGPDTPELLGQALTQILLDERLTRGERK